ncbi:MULTISPECIES: cation:proton antiporter [Legionella]|uniref:Cation:proton antiporter n=1 Tax=Legionella septentrionalis TaxID=2498109 RepID=A0A433JI28_9GAMM|nr:MULTISPECIES: cation:proton antiporter [Legionella]MCP0912935.1 cation:proton antiporter [Legionella sp. 27cVA30]RUQ84531.1 cation:proton antiporter [Legionella septentrionalis]RUQ96769.1 cation:proton antiporter [Legionella septentrionalis]RUR10124.1 cation:proton antiporter [Legionella septentrionalis]RUR15484.1 cation:proton antiporter [Legionella septentrionalis]
MSKLSYLILLVLFFPVLVHAGSNPEHMDPVASVIFWVTLIFLFGILGRYIASRLNQPGVLGELLMGMLLGNLCYYFGMELAVILREGTAVFDVVPEILKGTPLQPAVSSMVHNPDYAAEVVEALTDTNANELLKVAYVVDILSRYGVIFLLFMVGLETSLEELKNTGRESIQVAIIGVLAPIVFGLLTMKLLVPTSSFKADLFVGATLCATSVGITARVLKEMKKLRTREARTILGAAMMDDILGLIILAIVSSIVISDVVDMIKIIKIIVSALLFFSCSLLVGPWLIRKAVHYFRFLEAWELKLFISFVFVMTLAWLATVVQLASIIGAFAAGIIIKDGFFGAEREHKAEKSIQELVAPLEFLLAPLFFMLIGIQVKIELFFDPHVLLMAGALSLVAIIGKLLSGWGGNRRDNRFLIGVGMVPRGEVGLVFASIGRTLGVIPDQLFSAIILMVIVTTFITPPWLKSLYMKSKKVSK